ncbi:MAG: sigma-54-dependent Fis family transcriptional regulator [Candidatus Cloacimonetes bacterium]|nr:sigma-54-dependent Fis family transcriptional regulator [Candidatus Cloacimonadota bacterium]
MKGKIIILEDILEDAKYFYKMLINEGYDVKFALNSTEFSIIYDKFKPELNLLDLTLKNSEFDGIEVYRKLLTEKDFSAKVIVLSSDSPTGKVVEAIKLGAVTYHPKGADFDKDKFLLEVKQVISQMREIDLLQEQSLDTVFIGVHPKIKDLKKKIVKYSQSNMNILLTGETGTGKSLLAKLIHQLSKRNEKPFVDVDLKFFNENLIESELFGHVKGAFHGAAANKKGYFENAERGTLFLDEIANLSIDNQAKLIKFISEKRIPIVGGKFKDIDVRIISATNRNLTKLVREGKFREDLYHRFAEKVVIIPPLQERQSDVLILMEKFLHEMANDLNRKTEYDLSKIKDELMSYSWPGNIRPLKNLCRSIAEFNDVVNNKVILQEFGDLNRENKNLETDPELQNYPLYHNLLNSNNLYKSLENFEKFFIENHLERNLYRISKTAESINIDRATLYKKINKYGIEIPK